MKRIAFYLFWEKDGGVDRYVAYCLEKLREHVDHIVVVSNGPLTEAGRADLERVADDVWERENVGFDVWGYKEGLERFGFERLAAFDELILLNYTFFGPMYPFSEMFEKAQTWDVDFWGITEHKEVRPHPFAAKGVLERHIQSHWIAVRKPLLTSEEFREYWASMPMISSYEQSVDLHEGRFTQYFENLGFTSAVLFPGSDYASLNPILDEVVQLTAERLPILKRRTFFHSPLYFSDYAIIGRDVIDILEQTSDYPLELVWENIARTTEPRVAATNFSLHRIYSDALEITPEQLDRVKGMRALVAIHCYYEDMIDELMDYADRIPCEQHVVVTTDTEQKKSSIKTALARRGVSSYEVRITESNAGRDVSAFLLGCADLLRDDSFDIVVKLHSKRSPQDGAVAGGWFKRHLFGNLVHSANYAANVVNLFAERPEMGMVIPPVIHIGFPTLGKSWFLNKERAGLLCAKLGITTPLDESTPLSAYGSMFIARPRALRTLVDAGLTWQDFDDEAYGDGSLAHVVERLFTYSSLGAGMPVYTVQSTELASINYPSLEFKLQNFSQGLPGTVMQQRDYLDRLQQGPTLLSVSKRAVRSRLPRLVRLVYPAYDAGRRVYVRWRMGRGPRKGQDT
ncbi:rhamnan synthesis F family protein [Microbacterium hydrocarbonoxydans]|uniref:rhamnan synthesis F family protein n=1 Tax=Microbacterium hydrocarbonoxydans TaxID=273678 RepID=UPI002041F28F|nr:rhamnan synthesis F family protein [Microbacterium hydrocarbonoxydans]MCM3779315.1 rhamnan synthesis F family protein [Microbacterium hydrocarbonoxydans]